MLTTAGAGTKLALFVGTTILLPVMLIVCLVISLFVICAAVISLISDAPLQPAIYKERLHDLKGMSHVTVEVEQCLHRQTGTC